MSSVPSSALDPTRSLSGSGSLFALAAFSIWGFVPVFWKQLSEVPAAEILFYRILGSLVLAIGLLVATGGLAEVRESLRTPRQRWLLIGSSLFLGGNWWTFIYAVNADRIIDTSLGYFLTPILNVGVGTLVFSESLSRVQILAFVFAATGVGYLAYDFGTLPWISLVLGGSFAIYGALRKFGTISSLGGLLVESGVLIFPAGAILVWMASQGEATTLAGSGVSGETLAWLSSSGIVTALPLICFASAARRLPLSALGFFQYIAPCLSLVLAVWLYDEPFTRVHMVAFSFIWSALLLYAWDGLRGRVR